MVRTIEATRSTTELWTGIRRIDTSVVVQTRPGHELKEPGVVCINPDADQSERIYKKTFVKKPIFLPDQWDEAMNKYVRGPNVMVFAMTGYSNLGDDWHTKYRVKKGSYFSSCAELFKHTISSTRRFQAADARVIHGASHMGIDGIADTVAKKEFGLMPLGFSCPEFMMYVDDDETPVYVAKDKPEYSDYFVRSLDLLIVTGGREHSLNHDILASCKYDKRIHFVDIPNMLSPVGVPARIVLPNGQVRIENAAAAFGTNISSFRKIDSQVHAPADGDEWDALFKSMSGVATEVARKVLPAELMFKTR